MAPITFWNRLASPHPHPASWQLYCSPSQPFIGMLQLFICLYPGNDMPPAKVFHQKRGWLKAEGKQISNCWSVSATSFSGAVHEHTLLWEITVMPCFSSPVLSLPYEKKKKRERDIFGYRSTVFVRLVNSPTEISIVPLICMASLCR